MRARAAPCRVLLVDDSLQLSELARPLFSSDELVPSGPGCDYPQALDAVRHQQPDLVLVDLQGPGAFAAIEAVMAERPTPILVLRSRAMKELDPFEALALGALDVAERPSTPSPDFWKELARRLPLLAQIRVVQHIKGKKKKRGSTPDPAATEPQFPLVAIAASLGGPKALSQLLRMIPHEFPAPICICQHISDGFTIGLSQWLGAATTLKVVEAKDGLLLEPGSVYIAPSKAHLLVDRGGRIRLDDGPPLMGFKPSCNALLRSAAEAFGSRAIGVVLTGMGKDGAQGLMEIRSRGGKTIAQDEASCVVFGMPREAVMIGAAQQVLPLEEIAPALIRMVHQ